MTTRELNREALLDIHTMRDVGYLAQWHDSLLVEFIVAANYGNPN